MSSLISYAKPGPARFDFRVPDGLGNYVWPDWDDTDLRVKFYDSEDTLRFTATVESTPSLEKGDDFHEDHNPGGGKFVEVSGIDLSSYAPGIVEAYVYARVGGTPVCPWPTIISAFRVSADAAPGPCYAQVDHVKEEVPGSWPDSITDEMVQRAIASASRRTDAYLGSTYQVPFADIADDPPPPAMIERLCRKLAAYQCLEWMGRANAADREGLTSTALKELEALVHNNGKAPLLRLEGHQGPAPCYQGSLQRSAAEKEGRFDGPF